MVMETQSKVSIIEPLDSSGDPDVIPVELEVEQSRSVQEYECELARIVS